MEKQFSISLRVNARVADVVAEVGAFADYLEGKYGAGISGMTVDTTVQGWNPSVPDVFSTTVPATPTPPPEPDPAPAKRTRKAKAPEPAPAPAAETPPAEPQAEIEGADVEAEVRGFGEMKNGEPLTEPVQFYGDKPDPQPELTRPELTRDDVFEALRRLVTTKGNDAAVAALAHVGVKKFSDVPTTALPELYAVIQKVLA